MSKLATATGVPGLNRNDVYKLAIPVPPIKEQQRIAEILDTAENIKHLRKQAIETTQRIAPALFYQMFGSPVKNEKGWAMRTLGEEVEFLDSLRKPVKASERQKGQYPYYGANGQQGTIDGYIFDEPLVLIAEDGGHFTEPNKGIAYSVYGKCWVNNHAHVLRAKEKVTNEFLHWHLRHMNIVLYISGSTRGKLTKKDAERIPIMCPPIERQKAFDERLYQLGGLISFEQTACKQSDKLSSALSAQLLAA